jgi:type IV secretion system protein VirB9
MKAGTALACMVLTSGAAAAPPPDPRLRDVVYDARVVIDVPVKRGVVALVELAADETITELAAGLGGDCSKPEAAWCVAAQAGGRTVFVKAKSTASAPNHVAIVTDKRTHSLRFVVLADTDPKPAVLRLTVTAPTKAVPLVQPTQPQPQPQLQTQPALTLQQLVPLLSPLLAMPPAPPAQSPQHLLALRLQAKPQVLNTAYQLAEGTHSQDIVPTLVFDDGRFTYLRFAGNREVPAVFHVLGDGTETLVNTRMEDDLLVVDRVSRRLVLRAGAAVVGIWNEAFDADGVPPTAGTTVPGVKRRLKTDAEPPVDNDSRATP